MHAKIQGDTARYVRAVVLVPTKDLCQQLCDTLTKLVRFSNSAVKTVALVSQPLRVQQAMLAERPDVVVATPTQLLAHVGGGGAEGAAAAAVCDLSKLETFVVDEADLVLSFGYIDDLRAVLRYTPKTCQSCLVSATISEDLDQLRRVILHRPAILRLKEAESAEQGKLVQYYVKIGPHDKELLLYALLKLGLIKGKTIFFVNSVKQCYRFKLLLDLFDVRSAVLNAELPVNSRINIMSHFNRGSFDHLIATDESLIDRAARSRSNGGSSAGGGKKKAEAAAAAAEKAEAMKSYGAARGLDFQSVDTVVNIDFPQDEASYTHRIGRTARAGHNGTALSFVIAQSGAEQAALARVQETQPHVPGSESLTQPQLLPLDMKELEVFRYRVQDAAKSVTTKAVHEARLKDLKMELLTSKRLAEHFEVRERLSGSRVTRTRVARTARVPRPLAFSLALLCSLRAIAPASCAHALTPLSRALPFSLPSQQNPHEREMLRHDKKLRQNGGRNVGFLPSYLVPSAVRNSASNTAARGQKRPRGMSAPRRAESDPLQSFAFSVEQLSGAARRAQRGEATPFSQTGQSTSSRRAWQQRHKKGKFGRGRGRGGGKRR